MKKKALITGCYGQDGSFIAEQLYSQGYSLFGICRRELSGNSLRNKIELLNRQVNIEEIYDSIFDYDALCDHIKKIQPDLVFHMAAIHRSSEHKSNNIEFEEKLLFDNNVKATGNLLCGCLQYSPHSHIVTAGSCLMFDNSGTEAQNENTCYNSGSLYGLAKITEHSLIEYYRNKGLCAGMAILYNHESHRRSESFVTRKIAETLKRIKKGELNRLEIGDLTTKKDWGYAGDYANGMIEMALQDVPRDYIFATGELHTIAEYIEECAKILGIPDWEKLVSTNDKIITRSINGQLCGDPSVTERILKWKRSYTFQDMVYEIVKGDGNED